LSDAKKMCRTTNKPSTKTLVVRKP
jgi:hypothetical protein